jgi:hypothetical protein
VGGGILSTDIQCTPVISNEEQVLRNKQLTGTRSQSTDCRSRGRQGKGEEEEIRRIFGNEYLQSMQGTWWGAERWWCGG